MPKQRTDLAAASDPSRLPLSKRRFRRLDPEANGFRGWVWRWLHGGRAWENGLAGHLQNGDSRAAVVLTVAPLLMAAYTDELDCVAILSFSNWLVEEHNLKPGSRLLTINTYREDGAVAPDLIPGPNNSGQWANFHPVIAEFVSEDAQRIAALKAQIAAEEWKRCAAMGLQYIRNFPNRRRNGSPMYSLFPGQ